MYYEGDKLIYPAATRNKEPILQVLLKELPRHFPGEQKLFLLEISSGSGQHSAHFAPHFPHITFQPSECESDLLGSIGIYARECPTNNINQPLLIDISNDLSLNNFKENSIDIIYNSNMIHVSPYECSVGLFTNAGKYLKDEGIMITYGAYAIDGKITPESNVSFDQSIRARDPRWGLRDIEDLKILAKKHNISYLKMIDMPANNKCVVWKKVQE